MGKAVFKDIFLNALALSWIVASFWAFFGDDPDLFQRLGSWGVVVSVFYYLVIRPFAPVPDEIVKRFSSVNKHQNLNSQHIEGAYRNAALAAYELHKTRLELGLEPLPFGDAMKDVLKERLDNEPIDYEGFNKKMDTLDERELAANATSRGLSYTREVFQQAMAIVATIQWGFGDLFVNTLSMCGGKPC